jgi:hypothetical protein
MEMRHNLIPRIAVSVLTLTAPAAAVEQPSAEALIARNLEARGGAARWGEIKTLELRGTFDAWSEPIPMTIERARPARYRFDHSIFGTPATLGCDGTEPWIVSPIFGAAEPRPLDEAWRRNVIEDAGFVSRLQELAAAGASMEVVGKAAVEGVSAWKLRVAPADAPAEVWYLDAASSLELKRESTTFDVFSGAIEMPMETFYMDFRPVEGVRIPFREERHFGTRYHVFELQSVRVNPTIDAARLTAPKRPPAPATPATGTEETEKAED